MKLTLDPVTMEGNVSITVKDLKRILNKYSDDFVIQIEGGKEVCGISFYKAYNEDRFLSFKLEGDY